MKKTNSDASYKTNKLGNIKNTLGIDPTFGIYPIFRIRAKNEDSGGNFRIDTGSGEIEVQATVFPNFDDMTVFLSILKAFSANRGEIYLDKKKLISTDKTTKEVAVHVIRVRKRELLKLTGKRWGTHSYDALEKSIKRLASTRIIENDSEKNLVDSYNLVRGLTVIDDKMIICIEDIVIERARRKDHRVNWEALSTLKKQAVKGLQLYLDCHNYKNPSYLWMSRIIRFLTGIEKPKKIENAGSVEMKKQTETYKSYYDSCVEPRKYIMAAFETLKSSGLIVDYRTKKPIITNGIRIDNKIVVEKTQYKTSSNTSKKSIAAIDINNDLAAINEKFDAASDAGIHNVEWEQDDEDMFVTRQFAE